MNVDELKTAWQNLDKKLRATKELNEKMITCVVTERTVNRFRTVKSNYLIGGLWLIVCLGVGVAVIVGNPFDYQYQLQYVPMIIYCVGLTAIAVWMIRSYVQFTSIKLDQINIKAALHDIVAIYERPQKLMKYILWIFIFSQVVLFPLSFLPNSIGRIGLWPALGERLIPISIAVLILYLAHKLGAFKERYGNEFKNDLTELEQLKKMVAELD